MARVTTELEDQRLGIAPGTLAKQDGCFGRWERFHECAGIQDKFPDTYPQDTRITIVSAFAAALRRNEQGKTKRDKLMGGTVSTTVHSICSVFRTNLRRSPIVDEHGKMALAYARQIKGYIAEDPATKHQKCLPIIVFEKLWAMAQIELTKAI